MIEVKNLTKYYGNHLAVDDLSFTINDGHVYGFLGPNGAGKSTTMNIMTGCLSATDGSVLIDGHDIFEDPIEAKRHIGYLPEQPPLYLNETPLDYLAFVGEAKGLKGEELSSQINDVIEKTGIEDVKTKRISSLSKGYKQRVGIAQAILGNPSVIIFDEPTVGLDPLQIIEIRDLIKDLGRDHTVIFSSHILSEVQTICDQVLMIAKGKLLAFDTPENLEKNLLSSGEFSIVSDASREDCEKILKKVTSCKEFSFEDSADAFTHIKMSTDEKDMYLLSGSVFTEFAKAGKKLFEMSIKKTNLEDIFIELADSQSDVQTDEEDKTVEEENNK